jgi:TATA-box binding protein (TBP) (component of TFIID and TFIIIB)
MYDDIHMGIVNAVATCRLPFKVDIEPLAAMLPGQVELNSRYPRYRCAYVKVEGMKGVVTVFGLGAVIGVGSRSVKDAERDLTSAYKGPSAFKTVRFYEPNFQTPLLKVFPKRLYTIFALLRMW